MDSFFCNQLNWRSQDLIHFQYRCQYSSEDGLLNDWHLVHLGSFARGGAGLVFIEATAVTPKGRITPWDSGIWDDKHIVPIKRIVDFVHEQKVSRFHKPKSESDVV
jgi:2,4-dienoyl-CoA reductase-like NADH-dependent reductase (Old Yellow Enzyme family)